MSPLWCRMAHTYNTAADLSEKSSFVARLSQKEMATLDTGLSKFEDVLLYTLQHF